MSSWWHNHTTRNYTSELYNAVILLLVSNGTDPEDKGWNTKCVSGGNTDILILRLLCVYHGKQAISTWNKGNIYKTNGIKYKPLNSKLNV